MYDGSLAPRRALLSSAIVTCTAVHQRRVELLLLLLLCHFFHFLSCQLPTCAGGLCRAHVSFVYTFARGVCHCCPASHNISQSARAPRPFSRATFFHVRYCCGIQYIFFGAVTMLERAATAVALLYFFHCHRRTSRVVLNCRPAAHMGRSEGGQKKNQQNWCVPTARRPRSGPKGGQGGEFLRTICVHHRHGRLPQK